MLDLFADEEPWQEPLAPGAVVLRRIDAKVLTSSDGGFISRALFPFDGERDVEFYELKIAPGHTEKADAHAPGTTENLIVTKGEVELTFDFNVNGLCATNGAQHKGCREDEGKNTFHDFLLFCL